MQPLHCPGVRGMLAQSLLTSPQSPLTMLMMKRPTPVTSVQVRPCEEPSLAQLRSVFMTQYAGCQVQG